MIAIVIYLKSLQFYFALHKLTTPIPSAFENVAYLN